MASIWQPLLVPSGHTVVLAKALVRDDNFYADRFFNNRWSAVFANSCMFACRSLLPVSSVITSLATPATVKGMTDYWARKYK